MTELPNQSGIDIIKGFVRNLPNGPGVYRMFDENQTVIYVGKARNLKSRVTNYTSYEGNSNRICRMISATRYMEFVTTETESAALILEANMIKRLRPRFNVLLRDDKSFPYILITGDHEAPMLMKHRGSRRQKGDYFGPFASVHAVNKTVASLQKAFLLRNCTDSFYAGRSRPCLQHQIKRCAAPCTGVISIPEYGRLVQEARDFLTGKSKAVHAELQNEMNVAAENLEFEQAAQLRDRIAALSHVQGGGGINAQTVEEADVFAIHQEAGNFCVQVFFFRVFQNWGNHAFYPKADESQSLAEVLEAFIAQFYDSRSPAKLLLLSEDIGELDLLRDALSENTDHRVQIEVPRRGEKKTLVDQALNNAREALGRQLSDTASQKKLLDGMRETFGLSATPRRIEVYDNSHIQGTNAIGAMIVAGEEGLSKKHYRTFNIKSKDITPGDDFGMMREVLTRRFTRLALEHPETTDVELNGELPDWPDVLLIDGGLGQVNAVKSVISSLNLPRDVTIIGIAKGEERNAGRETFFAEGREPFMLPARDPVLYYTQRLRDEAHRFAIGTHRAKRNKEIVKNPLDEIEGIGPTRKRALLQHFGSAKAISRAALSDLTGIPGISDKIAQQIFDFFRKN